ncbi:MAG TPA: 50S ribosomal protein L11 methyltransferase [Hyphomicrobiales bacterium]|nr:50S ribosomal protein L11 methyltransferase [Hyphomicrobiales bacterium]
MRTAGEALSPRAPPRRGEDGETAMYRATIDLSQDEARRVCDAIGEEEAFGYPPAAAIELTPEAWQAEITFAEEPDAEALAAFAGGLVGRAVAVLVEELPDIDWVAASLAGLSPVAAGRFFVHGSHDRHRVPAGKTAIEIEAAQAFGTGHHGTTAGCLVAIDDSLKARRYRRPLDLGTGSGVLAIAIARTLRVPVLATDIDPVATKAARENAVANRAGPLIEVVTAAGFDHPRLRNGGPFDLVIANILARPLVMLAGAIAGNLACGGRVILSGLLTTQEEMVEAAYRGRGLVVARRLRIGEWSTLVFDDPRRI